MQDLTLVYFQQGQAVYQGDRLKATEWRLPELFYHQADGPDLQYIWYVFVERQNAGRFHRAAQPRKRARGLAVGVERPHLYLTTGQG